MCTKFLTSYGEPIPKLPSSPRSPTSPSLLLLLPHALAIFPLFSLLSNSIKPQVTKTKTVYPSKTSCHLSNIPPNDHFALPCLPFTI